MKYELFMKYVSILFDGGNPYIYSVSPSSGVVGGGRTSASTLYLPQQIKTAIDLELDNDRHRENSVMIIEKFE